MKSYASEFQARMTWALKQTSRSSSPDEYFNSYEAIIPSEHLALIYQGRTASLTNRTESIAIFAIWNNYVFRFEPTGSDFKETIFEEFFRAGGVDIPDKPAPQNPRSGAGG